DARQVLRRLWNGPYFVQQQSLRRGVGEIEHVVDAAQQAVDLRPVEGGDELPVQPLEGAVRDVVALVLHALDGGDLPLDVGEVLEEREQELGTSDGDFRLGVEVVEELVRLRHQFFEHAALYMARVTAM